MSVVIASHEVMLAKCTKTTSLTETGHKIYRVCLKSPGKFIMSSHFSPECLVLYTNVTHFWPCFGAFTWRSEMLKVQDTKYLRLWNMQMDNYAAVKLPPDSDLNWTLLSLAEYTVGSNPAQHWEWKVVHVAHNLDSTADKNCRKVKYKIT